MWSQPQRLRLKSGPPRPYGVGVSPYSRARSRKGDPASRQGKPWKGQVGRAGAAMPRERCHAVRLRGHTMFRSHSAGMPRRECRSEASATGSCGWSWSSASGSTPAGLPRAVPRPARPALGSSGARQARGDGRQRRGDSRRRRDGGHGVSNDSAAATLARRSLRLSLRFIDAFMAGFLVSSADRDSLFAGWQREARFGSRIDERRDLSCGRARASCTRLLRRSRDVPNGHSRAFLRGDASGFPPRSSEVSRWTHVHNP